MKTLFRYWIASIFVSLTLSTLSAQTANQSIALSAGWNAVWLEVEPVQANGQPQAPDVVFPAQVVTVISPRPLAGFAELFAQAPGNVATFNQDGWEQWHRGGAIGDDLIMIEGNRPYLIEATAAVTVSVTGEASFHRHEWLADRYNLLGFALEGTPSFDSFFSPSNGRHPVSKIYRLNSANGNWVAVSGTTQMRSNEAYWIFSSGPSDYMGPVSVDFDDIARGHLSFATAADAVAVDARTLDLEELVLTNLSASAIAPKLDYVGHSGSAADLALYAVRPTPGLPSYDTVAQIDSTVDGSVSPDLQESVAPDSTGILTIGAERTWNSGLVGRTNLYRLRTGGGSAFWLPVTAKQGSLQAPTDLLPATPAAAAAGLWVGEVVINSAVSIVENGAPERPVSSPAPIRVILHSNAAGEVQLLSQVTIMQTKSADASVEPTPVLVVDPQRIPFFEGIRERQGKRVGLRIESVAFSMPRKPGTSFPSEEYLQSLTATGALGAGKTVEATLTLDAQHRANPYRHAFHQQHASGPDIIRDLTLVFDAEQTTTDVLTGTYTEILKGVVKSDLELSGTINLRRVSAVATLDAQ